MNSRYCRRQSWRVSDEWKWQKNACCDRRPWRLFSHGHPPSSEIPSGINKTEKMRNKNFSVLTTWISVAHPSCMSGASSPVPLRPVPRRQKLLPDSTLGITHTFTERSKTLFNLHHNRLSYRLCCEIQGITDLQ